MNAHRPGPERDRGVALVLMLVLVVVLGTVTVSVARYATANLVYGQVVERRSNRLTAADAGMRYALDQIKLRARGCVWDDSVHVLPGLTEDFNGSTARVTCQRITSGIDDIQLYAAVMTGEGLPMSGSDAFLLSSQGGSIKKVLGGPVFMQRIDATAFSFDSSSDAAGVRIENGPLLYYDPSPGCTPVAPSTVVARALGKLDFAPELVYGPECINQTWKQKFKSPPIVRDLRLLPVRDGSKPLDGPAVTLASITTASLTAVASTVAPNAYFDVTGSGGCRVFLPGRYTTVPATDGHNAYFMSGDYVLDLPDGSAELVARQGVITAGRVNALIPGSVNERPNTAACQYVQAFDPALDGEGATLYLGRSSRIRVESNGALEIHARRQGSNFVSVQTLCDPHGSSQGSWCRDRSAVGFGGDGALGGWRRSTLDTTTTPQILYTNSGNGKEFVAHALFYAPLATAEFGNVSNSAVQKMLGGLAVGQLVLQSSTSATNFEIAVPTGPVTGRVLVTSEASDGEGTTRIRAVLQYRPYERDVDDRIRINSWRICEDDDCS